MSDFALSNLAFEEDGEESITRRSVSNSSGKFVVNCRKKNVTIFMIMIRLYVLQLYISIDLHTEGISNTVYEMLSIQHQEQTPTSSKNKWSRHWYTHCTDIFSSLLFFWLKHIPWWYLSCSPLLLDWKKDFLAWWWSVECKNTRMYDSSLIPNADILPARNESKISNPLLFTYSRNS